MLPKAPVKPDESFFSLFCGTLPVSVTLVALTSELLSGQRQTRSRPAVGGLQGTEPSYSMDQ